MAKNKYVIMGATGQIGHVVAASLLKKGHHVKALGRDQKKLAPLKMNGAEVIVLERFDDESFLTKTFKEADAIFGMIPPGYGVENISAFQDSVGNAIKIAIEKSSAAYLVNLSSIGANLAEGTGPIKGLHQQEERLNTLKNLNVFHLRPTYFMENLLWAIPSIKQTGTFKTYLSPKLPLPMVSTDDIGIKVAEVLEHLNFKGHSTFEFVGPDKDPLTLIEVMKILGLAIGISNLRCIEQSYEEAKKEMLNSGMKLSNVELMLEMYKAFNEGKCTFTQKLTEEHRGKTTIEQFAKKFEKAYRQYPEKQKIMA